MYEFHIKKRASAEEVVRVAEDALEAVSIAYPDDDFEVLDVMGARTHVLDIRNNETYIVTRGNRVD